MPLPAHGTSLHFKRVDHPRFRHTHTRLSTLASDEMFELLYDELLILQ
jgi:hypothetical protein